MFCFVLLNVGRPVVVAGDDRGLERRKIVEIDSFYLVYRWHVLQRI